MKPQIGFCVRSDGVHIAYMTVGEGPAGAQRFSQPVCDPARLKQLGARPSVDTYCTM
jgi:hypothetical protein